MINENLRRFLQTPDTQSERRVLYLTGLAGSGKTTIANIISQDLEAVLITEFLEPIPDSVMNTRVDSEYEAKVKSEQWVIDQCARKNHMICGLRGNIVVDRTWIDALVYSKVYGEAVLQLIQTEAEKYNWASGIYVVLFANNTSIKQRLQEKFALTENEWKTSWEPYIYDLREAVIKLAASSNLLALDTSDLNPVDASAIIESRFKAHFGK